MADLTQAQQKIFIDNDVDYTTRFIIENNFSAVQYKLAQYGIPVNSTLEAYLAVIALKNTDAVKNILDVPYIASATNGTGGLVRPTVINTASRWGFFDGTGINNILGGIGGVFSSIGSGAAEVVNSVGTSTNTILGGVSEITAPLLQNIIPSPQNKTTVSDVPTQNNTTIIVVVVVSIVIISIVGYFLFFNKTKHVAK